MNRSARRGALAAGQECSALEEGQEDDRHRRIECARDGRRTYALYDRRTDRAQTHGFFQQEEEIPASSVEQLDKQPHRSRTRRRLP